MVRELCSRASPWVHRCCRCLRSSERIVRSLASEVSSGGTPSAVAIFSDLSPFGRVQPGVAMKTLLASLFSVLLAVLAVAQHSNVIVNSGSGDGSYKGDPFVHVWSDPAPAGMVFDQWIGNTVLLQNPRESHTK